MYAFNTFVDCFRSVPDSVMSMNRGSGDMVPSHCSQSYDFSEKLIFDSPSYANGSEFSYTFICFYLYFYLSIIKFPLSFATMSHILWLYYATNCRYLQFIRRSIIMYLVTSFSTLELLYYAPAFPVFPRTESLSYCPPPPIKLKEFDGMGNSGYT